MVEGEWSFRASIISPFTIHLPPFTIFYMNKPLLGLTAGAGLGILDGLSALVSAPEVAPEIVMIVVGSCGKGLIAGLIIGFFARKVSNLAAGILFGIATSALVTLPIALAPNPANNNEPYFWEIIIPGMIVGLIVGFVTQRYGTRPGQAAGGGRQAAG